MFSEKTIVATTNTTAFRLDFILDLVSCFGLECLDFEAKNPEAQTYVTVLDILLVSF